ncbi:MAG: hypothetical protein CVU00_11825 [Bacteroidetes bacterium HGW-Bacteroidetes-17]|jgi:hypothetical protein|nr:MAG: hypothetical protein CVU00_11825 [Bacteroidetes bacterium HGW-Bacteroidetes-17]
MSKFALKSGLTAVLAIFLLSAVSVAQSNQYEVTITTIKGESYHLIEVRGYGGFEFQCLQNKAEFKLKFDKIKSIQIEKKQKGQFRKAMVALDNGQLDEIWIKTSFKEKGSKTKTILLTIEGKSKEYGSLVRLNIKDIKKINFL